MKIKVIIGISTCLLIVVLIGIFQPTIQAQQRADQPNLYAIPETASAYTHYKLIHTNYWGSGGKTYLQAWHHIHNKSLSNSLKLGPIYIFTEKGVNGPIESYNGKKDFVVPPLGCENFAIADTGVAMGTPTTSGPVTVAVTWDGNEDDLVLEGAIGSYDGNGNQVAIRTVTSFDR